MASYEAILRVLMEREPDKLRNAWKHKGRVFRFTLDDKYDCEEDPNRFKHEVPQLPENLIRELPKEFR